VSAEICFAPDIEPGPTTPMANEMQESQEVPKDNDVVAFLEKTLLDRDQTIDGLTEINKKLVMSQGFAGCIFIF
jgi:hypothetical protein